LSDQSFDHNVKVEAPQVESTAVEIWNKKKAPSSLSQNVAVDLAQPDPSRLVRSRSIKRVEVNPFHLNPVQSRAKSF
jgi:hypothetical protein